MRRWEVDGSRIRQNAGDGRLKHARTLARFGYSSATSSTTRTAMLTLGTTTTRTCEGLHRRALLRLGGLSIFGLSLPRVLAARAAQSAAERKDVNCIVLWMGGGASNIDTFDMKPQAPVEYRGEFSPIDTNLPGLQVCEHLPLMSQRMDKICLLRSLSHTESGDHTAANHYLLTGYPQRPDPSGQPAGSLIYPAYGSV